MDDAIKAIKANSDIRSGDVKKTDDKETDDKERDNNSGETDDKEGEDKKTKVDEEKVIDLRYKNLVDLIINNPFDDNLKKIGTFDNIISIDDLLFYNEKLTNFYIQLYKADPKIANNVLMKWISIKDTKERASQIYKDLVHNIWKLDGKFDKETLIELMKDSSVPVTISESTGKKSVDDATTTATRGKVEAATSQQALEATHGKVEAATRGKVEAATSQQALEATHGKVEAVTHGTAEAAAVLATSQQAPEEYERKVVTHGTAESAAVLATSQQAPEEYERKVVTHGTAESAAVLATSQQAPEAVSGGDAVISALRAVNDNNISQSGGNFKDLKDYISKYKENINNTSNIKAIADNYGFDNIDKDNKITTPESALSRFIESYTTGIKIEDKNTIFKAVDKLDNDPTNPLKSLEIKYDDRIVFIAITFVIRYVTLLLIIWCIEIDTIKSFNDAFILFTFIYIVIFWFIVMIINANISQDSDENSILYSIKSVLYYFYFKINGIERLITHTVLILLLLTIPVIIKAEKKENSNEPLTYEEKIKLTNILSLFTIFMWVFTSIIATKF